MKRRVFEQLPKSKSKNIYQTAQKKGLRIQIGMGGYCICLPNGTAYLAKDMKDLTNYVTHY